MKTQLPLPDAAARAASESLRNEIIKLIENNHGFLPFTDYMQHVLYAPHYGYYSGGSHKIGSGGDFVTAPQLTPLFGQTLARQFTEILPQTAGNLYEFGAGTGALAVDIISALPPDSWHTYSIVEISPDLRARQQALLVQKIPHLAARVQHLDRLPETFDGIIFGNEVLDAMPCECVEWRRDGLYRLGVEYLAQELSWGARAASSALCEQAAHISPLLTTDVYRSELHPQQEAFVRTLAAKLQRGAMIWIDYGFDENEYYHPQRHMGTLIGHYRHHTVDDPFFLPGLVDWTAHVNFSGIAAAACAEGLDFIGYTTQGNFLIQAGITAALETVGSPEDEAYIRAAAACQKLLASHEMGELFKVIAFGTGIDPDWSGLRGIDLSAKL